MRRWFQNESKAIQVVMIGPRRAGKTTLLAVMHERFASVVGAAGLQLHPDEQTAAELQRRWTELVSMVRSGEADIGPGIAGTSDAAVFHFALHRRTGIGRETKLALQFVDLPGGWLCDENEQGTGKAEEVKRLVIDSQVVIVAIDAPYLMENDGAYHAERNLPQQIAELLGNTLGESQQPRLVILAVTRCESYVRSPAQAALVRERVKAGYSALITRLRTGSARDRVMTVIAPVQTTGCVSFSHWDEVTGSVPRVRPIFRADKEARYAPKDSEQPLRYVLLFTVREYLRAREQGFGGRVRNWFSLDAGMLDSAREFAHGCKNTGGFEILGTD